MRTIENILCPIDVERPSNAALRYAFFLAEAFYASLDVVHARGTPDLTHAPGLSATPKYPKSENLMRELGTLLRAVTTSVPGRAAAHVVEGGPLSAILRTALRFQTDLIVVGSRFEASPTWLFGSNVGEQLAYAAACPVLSVPERAPPSPLRVRRILLPVASGRSATLAVQWTAEFARRFGATVELLDVDRDPGPHPSAEHPGKDFEELREMLRVAGIGVKEGGSVRSGAFERILERTESSGCDLVVMAAEPRGKRMSVTQPSLTATICRHALIPVLSVRGAQPGSAVAKLGSADRNSSWSPDESRASA
jgi:nucleotide-binding universal stress UspA family protein